jgi:hypothetical protein
MPIPSMMASLRPGPATDACVFAALRVQPIVANGHGRRGQADGRQKGGQTHSSPGKRGPDAFFSEHHRDGCSPERRSRKQTTGSSAHECRCYALVRSRPPGRLVDGGKRPIHREKSGTRASRADQGVRPPIMPNPQLCETRDTPVRKVLR